MSKLSLTLVPLVLMQLLPAQPVTSQDTGDATKNPKIEISPDTRVAIVNEETLTVADMELVFETLQPQYRQLGLSRVYPQLMDRLIERTLMVQKARAMGMDKTDAFQRQVDYIAESLLEQGYLDQVFTTKIKEEALKKAYDAYEPPVETQASHILVDDEETALELMKKIKDGADFTELAKGNSTGPSGSSGGQLGYFTKDRMVPPFAEAAFATEPGSVHPSPVKTKFGWHIIKVTDRRKAEKPTFEQMRDMLMLELQEKVLEEEVTKLRENASVEIVDLTKLSQPAETQPTEE